MSRDLKRFHVSTDIVILVVTRIGDIRMLSFENALFG